MKNSTFDKIYAGTYKGSTDLPPSVVRVCRATLEPFSTCHRFFYCNQRSSALSQLISTGTFLNIN